jgi:hypothetical protein
MIRVNFTKNVIALASSTALLLTFTVVPVSALAEAGTTSSGSAVSSSPASTQPSTTVPGDSATYLTTDQAPGATQNGATNVMAPASTNGMTLSSGTIAGETGASPVAFSSTALPVRASSNTGLIIATTVSVVAAVFSMTAAFLVLFRSKKSVNRLA